MSPQTVSIPGYAFGDGAIATSPVSLQELENLKATVGLSPTDEQYLRIAGRVLEPRIREIVEHWRGEIIAGIPNLARHSRSLDDKPLPQYLARSNRRFEQWILDTCLRPYDQDWLNYQQEIASRHMVPGKNRTDHVESTPYVPLRDIIAFVVVMNATLKPYLRADGHSIEDVDGMHAAWCKSLQLQLALWARPYSDARVSTDQW